MKPREFVAWCEANIRIRHPSGSERPCTRNAVRRVGGIERLGVPGVWLCEQHARQAEAGVNIWWPERPVVKKRRKRS